MVEFIENNLKNQTYIFKFLYFVLQKFQVDVSHKIGSKSVDKPEASYIYRVHYVHKKLIKRKKEGNE